jgi:hypothetical protein
MILTLLALLGPDLLDYGTGREWLPLASVIVPAALLVAIIWLGSRNTV